MFFYDVNKNDCSFVNFTNRHDCCLQKMRKRRRRWKLAKIDTVHGIIAYEKQIGWLWLKESPIICSFCTCFIVEILVCMLNKQLHNTVLVVIFMNVNSHLPWWHFSSILIWGCVSHKTFVQYLCAWKFSMQH